MKNYQGAHRGTAVLFGLLSCIGFNAILGSKLREAVGNNDLKAVETALKSKPSATEKKKAFEDALKRKPHNFKLIKLLVEAGIAPTIQYEALKDALKNNDEALIGFLAFAPYEENEFFAIGMAASDPTEAGPAVLRILLSKRFAKEAFDFHDIRKALESAKDVSTRNLIFTLTRSKGAITAQQIAQLEKYMIKLNQDAKLLEASKALAQAKNSAQQETILAVAKKERILTDEQIQHLKEEAMKFNQDKKYKELQDAVKSSPSSEELLDRAFKGIGYEDDLSEFYALEEAIKRNDLETFRALMKALRNNQYKGISLQTIKLALKVAESPQYTNLKEFERTLNETLKEFPLPFKQ